MKISISILLFAISNMLLRRDIVAYPIAININYWYGFGSLLGLLLLNQLVTGILLACYYMPSVDFAFNSVDYIMRDVNYGWLIRYMHSNGASFFFILLYIHIARAFYYGSYKKPRHKVWVSGIILFVLIMGTAFIGYVLPLGQMSLWGAIVISNFLTVIPYLGELLAQWLWGGFIVGEPTITRFFALHFLLPFIISALSILHILLLHQPEGGASNIWLGIPAVKEPIRFHPYFQFKDMIGAIFVGISFFFFVFYYPNYFAHSDNYIFGNALITPEHIVPEWYFLPFYAILRAIPNKIFGIIAMFATFVILALLPFCINSQSSITSTNFNTYFSCW